MIDLYGLQFFGFVGMDLVHNNLKKPLFVAKSVSDRERILDVLCDDVKQAYNKYDHSYTGTGILCNVETLEREAVKRFIVNI